MPILVVSRRSMLIAISIATANGRGKCKKGGANWLRPSSLAPLAPGKTWEDDQKGNGQNLQADKGQKRLEDITQ